MKSGSGWYLRWQTELCPMNDRSKGRRMHSRILLVLIDRANCRNHFVTEKSKPALFHLNVISAYKNLVFHGQIPPIVNGVVEWGP